MRSSIPWQGVEEGAHKVFVIRIKFVAGDTVRLNIQIKISTFEGLVID